MRKMCVFTYNAPDDGADDNEEGSDEDTSLDPRLIKDVRQWLLKHVGDTFVV